MSNPTPKMQSVSFRPFDASVKEVANRCCRAAGQEQGARDALLRAERVRAELQRVERVFETELQELHKRTLAAQKADQDRLEREVIQPAVRAVSTFLDRAGPELQALREQVRALEARTELEDRLIRQGSEQIQQRKDLSSRVKNAIQEESAWLDRMKLDLERCDPR